MRNVYFLAAILGLHGLGCGNKGGGDGTGSATGSKTGSGATGTGSSTASGTAKPTKGSGDGPSGGTGLGGPEVAGEVVIKGHELPAPTKPVAEFSPKKSGFKFQNYGNEPDIMNLTVTEARRMFGDQVCASLEGDKCVLTPAAAQWLEESNKGMGGGHCEGFAALALLMETGQIDPKLFGGASVAELELKGNEKLQREIAYWFVTQGVSPMSQAEDKTITPVQVVEKLAESFKAGAGKETFTLGIYAPGYKQGHAMTPYAVVEKENDVAWIMHYDNNYPGEEKHVEVDKKANTWSYTTAADPNAPETAYKGDAETKTLTIAPTSVRTGKLECHFCGNAEASTGAARGHKGALREISLEGGGDLLITDDSGKRLGYADGKLVTEIEGSSFAPVKGGAGDEPDYFIPEGHKLKVTLDGAGLKEAGASDLSLFGKGYTLAVEGIQLEADQKDEIDFAADFSSLTYITKKSETPTLTIGIETAGADYAFEVKVVGETAGQQVELSIDVEKGVFALKVKSEGGAKPTLSVKLTRIEKGGAQVFQHEGVAAGEAETITFGYGAWKGDKSPLHVALLDGSGKVLSEQEVTDDK